MKQQKIPVILTDGKDTKEFSSLTKASEFLGISRNAIIRNSVLGISVKGYKISLVSPIETKDYPEANSCSQITNTSINSKGYHLILGCVHSPFYNKKVMNKVINLTKDVQFKSVSFIGDLTDMTSLSKYDENNINKGLSLSEEYETTEELISQFSHIKEKFYLEGNHEYRFNRFMKVYQNSKIGDALKTIEDGINLKKYNVKFITNYPDNYINLNGIQLIHGIYTSTNALKKHLEKVNSDVIFAHTHKVGMLSVNSLYSYNIGFLGEVDSPIFSYVSRFEKKDWVTSFAIVYIDEENNNHVYPIIVKNNKFAFNNKLY